MAVRDDRIHCIRTMRATRKRPMTVRAQVRAVWSSRHRSFDLPEGVAEEAPVHAEINPAQHLRPGNWVARWIVVCPDCGGAEDADPEEPLFFCLSCYSDAVDGRWRPVLYPAEHDEVERLLMERPHAVVRCFLPGESVAELRRQNDAIRASGAHDLDWRRPGEALPLYARRLAAIGEG